MFFVPLNLVQVQGYTPSRAGAALLPLILLIFLLSRWSAELLRRYKARTILVSGPLIAAAGLALFARPGTASDYWSGWFPAITVLGLGMAVSIAPLATKVMNSVPFEYAGGSSRGNNAVSRVAGMLAIAVLVLALNDPFARELERRINALSLPPETRARILGQRSRLAAIATDDAGVRDAINQSFIDGFRVVVWSATGLAL